MVYVHNYDSVGLIWLVTVVTKVQVLVVAWWCRWWSGEIIVVLVRIKSNDNIWADLAGYASIKGRLGNPRQCSNKFEKTSRGFMSFIRNDNNNVMAGWCYIVVMLVMKRPSKHALAKVRIYTMMSQPNWNCQCRRKADVGDEAVTITMCNKCWG